MTKIFYSNARIIRLPFDIRGKKFIDLGTNLTTGKGCRLEAFPIKKNNHIVMKFGDNVQINDYCHISAMQSVIIEDGVLMAGHVYVSDNSHGIYRGKRQQSTPKQLPIDREPMVASVRIGKNTWIGEGVVIMPGVTIGQGCIIGANSVVTKPVPANSMAAGVPAKIIKQYSEETQSWNRI